VHLGVVDPERLDLDHRVAGFGLRFRDLSDDQLLRPAELRSENRTHETPSRSRQLARIANPWQPLKPYFRVKKANKTELSMTDPHATCESGQTGANFRGSINRLKIYLNI
jgi:hypothetical protein